jgi:antitoxin StbD
MAKICTDFWDNCYVADSYLPVRPVSEAREELSRALARFRREGAAAAPVIFGSHRKPEAVVIPFEVYAEIVEYRLRRQAAADAIASVQAEVPGEYSARFKADLEAAVEGSITADEFYARTVPRRRGATTE